MSPASIARYHVLDFGTLQASSKGASALIDFINSPKGIRHMTGPRRAVIYGERADGAVSEQAKLYLSDGALEAAREINLTFKVLGVLEAGQLPDSAILLQGQP